MSFSEVAFGGLIREASASIIQMDKQQHMVCQFGLLDMHDTKSGLKQIKQASLRALKCTNILEMSL